MMLHLHVMGGGDSIVWISQRTFIPRSNNETGNPVTRQSPYIRGL
jgi:hypothetical protein